MSSFSESVKEELLRTVPEKPCCMLSELSAMTQHSGTLILKGRGRLMLRYHADSTALAKRIMILLKRRLRIVPQIVFHEETRFGRHRCILLNVQENDTRRLLTALQMLKADEGGVMLQRMPRNTMSRKCCQRSFIRAMFLGCGSVRDPSAGYTMEFSFSDADKAQAFEHMLDHQNIAYRVRQRRKDTVVYLPSGETVADMLTMMGAPLSRLSFEDQRIIRGSSARAARATNCDTANLSRQLKSAQDQLVRLRQYLKDHPLHELPDDLRETARVRLEHPSLTIEELGLCFSRPMTKSGVYHRLMRLMKYIDE